MTVYVTRNDICSFVDVSLSGNGDGELIIGVINKSTSDRIKKHISAITTEGMESEENL